MHRKSIVAFCIAVAVLAGCSQKQEAPGKIQAVTSIFPLCDIAANIAGGRADVSFIVPAGANPHVYEPAPSAVTLLSRADVFIGVDDHFDGWIIKFLPSAAIKTFLAREGENPHLWLSLKNAPVLAGRIAEIFIQQDPEGESVYKKNLKFYHAKIKEADEKASMFFKNISDKRFIQWHDAWDGFAADYGLSVFGTIEGGHGKEISVKQFRDLAVKAKRENVRVVVLGLSARNTAAESFTKEINGIIARLDTIGDPSSSDRSSYLDLMLYNAQALSRALK
ncbi:MAG TPA: metal ABC transporter substrate-binding protein [Spirochaetota bacterium]|nr:metal ABC transporter substrate-binding protein [Spirochaetota bacterium]HPI87731.1 metal ABC transporter substrate-binding protein [Spirochaetota bacterium]HPR48144.1 metal ABC transporter substrate-binding protein [Spirochaetota bacterium]